MCIYKNDNEMIELNLNSELNECENVIEKFKCGFFVFCFFNTSQSDFLHLQKEEQHHEQKSDNKQPLYRCKDLQSMT